MKSWIAIVFVLLAASGCKQGRGERCEVDEDCAEGTCSTSEPKTCGGEDNQEQIDASIPIDAPPAIDAP